MVTLIMIDNSSILNFSSFLKFYLFSVVLGLHCCAVFSLVAKSRGYSLVMACGLLTAVAPLVAEHRL